MSPRLLVLLLAFCSLNLAFAEDHPGITQKSPDAVTKPNSTDPSSSEPSSSPFRYWAGKTRVRGLRPDLDATCYTMRTYLVQRDESDSDSVHPVSYTTCQPAPRFAVKVTTQQPVEKDSDSK